jgi:hypothetical protein
MRWSGKPVFARMLPLELTGADDESEDDARQIAEEIVDEELP